MDFAPRDKFDIHQVVRDTNLKLAGLLGWPVPRTFSQVSPVIPSGGENSSAPATPSIVAGAAAGHEGEGGR
jgi:hypothetical protein